MPHYTWGHEAIANRDYPVVQSVTLDFFAPVLLTGTAHLTAQLVQNGGNRAEVVIGIGNDGTFRKLCQEVGKPELGADQFLVCVDADEFWRCRTCRWR